MCLRKRKVLRILNPGISKILECGVSIVIMLSSFYNHYLMKIFEKSIGIYEIIRCKTAAQKRVPNMCFQIKENKFIGIVITSRVTKKS